MNNSSSPPREKRRIAAGIYFALMSGVFAGAEARMGVFARIKCSKRGNFPLEELCKLIRRHYGINGIDDLLSRHLDLTLNIAHGGITLDNNPDNLQRDHIFPKSTLSTQGVSSEKVNHYGNFHFLRGKDNLNKSNIPPHEWFARPGEQPPYSDQDLTERLIVRELLLPGQFDRMLQDRSGKICQRALDMFGMTQAEFDRFFPRGPTLMEILSQEVSSR